MLGRLLNTATSTFTSTSHSPRSSGQLESVTEEEHTSGLLFPDISHLHGSKTHAYPLQTTGSAVNASAASSFDDHGGFDVDALKDFRVIIAQNAIGDRDHPCMLLDSQPLTQTDHSPRPSLENQRLDRPRRGHSRHSTIARTPSKLSGQFGPSTPSAGPVPGSHPSSAFLQARNRRSTFSTAPGDGDPLANRLAPDATELGLLNCVFGSSAFNYRGSSTKMHILPSGGEPPQEVNNPGSYGLRRRSHLYRSTDNRSQSQVPNSFHGRAPPPPKTQSPTKVAVLVTRLFSVNLPETFEVSAQGPENQPSSAAESFHENEFPFFGAGKRKKIKEKKTPMYAVAMVVHLPLTTRNNRLPPSQHANAGDSPKQPAYLSVSLDSNPRSFFDDHFGSNSTTSGLDDRIEVLVDHWDIINRTLSHVEKLASNEILKLLKQVDASSVRYPKPAKPPNMQRTNQRIVQLPPNSLFGHSNLREEVLRSAHRVCMALRIPRVVTGQSRWGIWREEARWIARYLNDKEHNFFFLVLITAFLGNHTEWLSSLGPDWHRRRHNLQQKAQFDNELIMSNRTVVISPDKMTARRLIFVLSAFLPPQQRSDGFASPLRPSTSASVHPYCKSPPTFPISRQESLRRTINKRTRTRQLNDEVDGLKISDGIPSSGAPGDTVDDGDFTKSYSGHGRRDSDARSIRTGTLPIPPNDARTSKSGTATAATAAPGTATPVPHFASQRSQRRQKAPEHQGLESNQSAASVNLLQQLQRSESFDVPSDNGGDGQSSSRWSGLFSGLWAQSSFKDRPYLASTQGGASRRTSLTQQPEYPPAPIAKADKAGKLDAGGVASTGKEGAATTSSETHSAPRQASNTAKSHEDTESQSLESPVKLTVEANDGIVDVELPLPGFFSLSSSGDSTLASPKKTRTSVTSVDSGTSAHSGNPCIANSQKEYDGLNVNVAGWLKRYHDDFLLQAVCPYSDVVSDVKGSMSAEPTPSHLVGSGSEKWVDVCTTLVADTRTFTVKRLRLRRKLPAYDLQAGMAPSEHPSPTSPSNSLLTSQISHNGAIQASSESPDLEEEFVEEPVMDLDGTLVDAVERVIARSGPPSAIHSRTASPNRLRRGKSGLSETGDANTSEGPSTAIPRNECRRTVLGALEEVVRSVAAERRQDDDNPSGRGRRASIGFADNTLREGVRKWLLDVEEAY